MNIKVWFMPRDRFTPAVSMVFDGVGFDLKEGTLILHSAGKPFAAYAPGTWHSVIDVGAFDAAWVKVPQQEPTSENPRRRQEARAIPKA